jgi:hypothetical protein
LKIGNPVTNLTNLKITPVMLSSASGQHQIRQAIGIEGTAVQVFEAYTEAHAHTDSSVSVNQMPDVEAGDKLVVGSVTYSIKWCEQQPATTGFGATMLIYITEDKRE